MRASPQALLPPSTDRLHLLSAVADRLALFWVASPFLMKFGTARFRRWLVDIAVWLAPSNAPRQMRNIIDCVDNTAQALFQKEVATLGPDDLRRDIHSSKEGSILRSLCELCCPGRAIDGCSLGCS